MLTRTGRIRQMEANQGRQVIDREANQGRQKREIKANQDRQPQAEKSNDVGIYYTPLDSEKSLHDPTKQKAAIAEEDREVYSNPRCGSNLEELERDFLYNGARCEGSFMRNSKEEDVHYIDKRCNDNLE